MDNSPGFADPARHYTLLGADGRDYRSPEKGTLGGHRRSRIYGRLDCPSALQAIARGGYVAQRVFFADAAVAEQAGYRPCGVCLREAHRVWKRRRDDPPPIRPAVPNVSAEVTALIRLATARSANAISLGGGRQPEAQYALDALEAAWTARGGHILTRVDWPAQAASWNRQAHRLTDWAPDLWIIADTPGGWAPVARRLHITARWSPDRTLGFGFLDTIETIRLAGPDLLDGMTGSTTSGGRWWIRGNDIHRNQHPTLFAAP